MPPTNKPKRPALTLSACALLLSACASKSPPLPVVVQPPNIPPLPAVAQQPPPPPICRPTCSAGLATLLESWLPPLTPPAPPASPASGPTKP